MPNLKNETKNECKFKNTWSLKTKKSFIKFKRSNEKSDSEKQKWVKVTWTTSTFENKHILIKEFENLILKETSKTVNIRILNPTYEKGRFDFCLKVSKDVSNVIYHKSSYITKFDIKCTIVKELIIPPVFPEDWKILIQSILNKRFIMNVETGECQLDLSNFSNDPFLLEHGLILNMSNTVIMKNVFNMLKEGNLKKITKLILSKNEICNLYQIQQFFEHCSVLAVDLSDNLISKISDFKFMGKNEVIDLNISNNNLCAKLSAKQLQEQIRQMIPKLTILNGKSLPQGIIVAGDQSTSIKTIPASIKCDKTTDVYTKFVLNYCTLFDNLITREAISDFYCSESVFSLSCCNDNMGRFYRSNNTNSLSKKSDASYANYKVGKVAIAGMFDSFPKTKHIEKTLNVDIIDRNVDYIIFTLSGVFVEIVNNNGPKCRLREFSRTFVIKSDIILNDHIILMADDSKLDKEFKNEVKEVYEQINFFTKYKEELKHVAVERHDVVRNFKHFTGMTLNACLEFFAFAKTFDFSEVKQKFIDMRNQGLISKEAYD